MTVWTSVPSLIGPLLLVGHRDDEGLRLAGLYMDGHLRGPAVAPGWRKDPASFAEVADQLAGYFAGSRRTFDVRLDLVGTPFQARVWDELRTIPYGRTTTYAALAERIGRPGAARAVGSAVARNPVSIIVPCHRVVGSDGSLTGFAGGTERKRLLLAVESGIRPGAGTGG